METTETNNIEEIVELVFQRIMTDIGKHYKVSDTLSDILSDSLSEHLPVALTKAKEQGANEKYEQGWNEGSVYESERIESAYPSKVALFGAILMSEGIVGEKKQKLKEFMFRALTPKK